MRDDAAVRIGQRTLWRALPTTSPRTSTGGLALCEAERIDHVCSANTAAAIW
jgi:hypothetical protein